MRKLSFWSVFIVVILGSVSFASLYYHTFNTVRSFPVTSWTEDHQADCAVLLTGGPNRTIDAFEQLYLGRVQKVIVSGVNPRASLEDIFPQAPYYGKLDLDDIILEKRSLSTYGNAQQALPLVEALNCKDVVLITSKLHMTRAYRMFRAHFPADIPIYKRSTVGRRYRSHWSRVAAESLKTVFYDLWFY